MTAAETLERALIQHETGMVAEAAALCRTLLAEDGRHAGALNLLGVIEAQHGRYAEALRLFDASLEAEPIAESVQWNRANVLSLLGEGAAAARGYRRALAIQPAYAEAMYSRANLLLGMARTDQAAIGLVRALASRADFPEALYVLGNILQEAGRTGEAVKAYDGVLRLWPGHPETLTNRASALLRAGTAREAVSDLRRALVVRPELTEAWGNLGQAALMSSEHDLAMRALDRALAVSPRYPMALNNRGNALSQLGRFEDALIDYDRALALQAHDPLAHYNRGNALWRLRRHREGRVSIERALALEPIFAQAWGSHGGLMIEIKSYARARSSYERLVASAGKDPASSSTYIGALNYFPGMTVAEQQAIQRSWHRRYAAHLPAPPCHANRRHPHRRLVVGYVSADFRAHATATVFGVVLSRHDRRDFEVVCYSNTLLEDRKTEEFKKIADRWRPIAGLPDEAVAQMIRADGIDILVDLSGHTDGNRLLVFARKPAPVQVTAWGQASGTGLPTIDYAFGDSVSVPSPVRPHFAEEVWDLPCSFPFEAPPYAPPVSPGPGARGEAITFGCLNRFNKISVEALALWGKIIGAVPQSRLLIKDAALDDPDMRRLVTGILARQGVSPDRVEFRGGTRHAEHLQAYNDVDIVLDPFPNNGGVNTWEALWMGRPVVTKLSACASGRVSAGTLTGIGVTDWIVESEAGYREKAIALADLDVLRGIRESLRARILASEAGNPEAHTRAVERAYREMWKRWCERV